MSKFSEKLFRGEKPTDSDWTEHLIEAHQLAPSMTPKAYASYKTSAGRSSYQLLAETLEGLEGKQATVVDLACGDGYLIPSILEKLGAGSRVIGVDMSEAELKIARQTQRDPRVTFLQSKAQSLPLENGSVDRILCHMAFMLMLPLEPVVSEIARVLRPGGSFSAVTGNSARANGLLAKIRKFSADFIGSRYPAQKAARSGDPRVSSLEGLREIFRPELGFGEVGAPLEFELEVSTPPAGVWELVKDMYFIGMLPAGEKELLKRDLTAYCALEAGALGVVGFGEPMKLFTVVKKGQFTFQMSG